MRLLMLCISLLLIVACSPKKTHEQRAVEIHKNFISVDSHTDTPLRLARGRFDISVKNDRKRTRSRLDLPRMKEGKLDAVFLAAFTGQGKRDSAGNARAKKRADRLIDIIYQQADSNKSEVELIFSTDELAAPKAAGKRMFFIGMENGYPLGTDLNLVDEYYKKGVRYITLCHTKNNDICDSSNDTLEHNGLTKFGESVVKRMNELGMMVDISHVSDKSFYDVLKITKVPVIASHSCLRALCNNPRNLSDDMLKALAKNGGVVQVTLFSDYIKDPVEFPEREAAYAGWREKYPDYNSLSDENKKNAADEYYAIDEKFPRKLATVAEFVDHIDHAVKVAGINHVGISSDFDGGGGIADCADVSEMKNITVELLRRGYSERAIAKIWGGNFFRVMKEAEKAAVN